MKPADRNRESTLFAGNHLICTLVVGWLLCTGQHFAQGKEPEMTELHGAESRLRVEFVSEQVKVLAEDIPVEELLLELALRCGLEVIIDGHLGERVSLRLDGVSLPEAVRQVVGDHDFSLVYSNPDRRAASAFPAKRGKLWIFTSGSEESAHPTEDSPAAGFTNPVNSDGGLIEQAQGDLSTRVAAVRSLESLPADEALYQLSTALADEYAGVREEAVSGLSDLGSEEAAIALSVALNDEDEWVREAAVQGLSEFGGDLPPDLLELALQDEQVNVREAAVDALAEVGGRSSIERLKQLLGDEDDGVRAAVIQALAGIGGTETMQALAIGLRDRNASIREESVAALGGIGSEASDQLLREALADTDERIREAARTTLARSVRNSHQ